MIELFKEKIQASIETKQRLAADDTLLAQIRDASMQIIDALTKGNKILIAGNGGSAADAQHIASEFVSKYNYFRRGLSCFALTTDASILTSVSNDLGYERVFARQIDAHGKADDIFIGISTSGTSGNIIEAIKEGKKRGLFVIGLTGQSGGLMREGCDLCICVPSESTPRIQEAHILIGHIICDVVEEHFFALEAR